MLKRFRLRFRSLFFHQRVENELREEFEFHLAKQTEQYLARGMNYQAAQAAAMRDLGGIDQLKEECRDARRTRWLENMLLDLRHAIRLMIKNPGFSAAAVLTIALATGSATAIFGVVYSVMLQPLPYGEPDRLVSIWTKALSRDIPKSNVTAAAWRDWRAQAKTIEDMALVRPVANFNLTGDGEPLRLMGARTTANLFSVLGVSPLLGRTYSAENERPGADRVLLLSYSLWQSRFAADPGIVNRTIRLNGEPWTVLGVMGPSFRYPSREFQLWAPLYVPDYEYQDRLPYQYLSVGRLAPGQTVPQAQAELDAISDRLAKQYPGQEGIGAGLSPMLDGTVRPVRTALYLLLGAVGCLLLIGCANVANLFLARGLARNQERAVRAALGASGWRLAWQAVAEIMPPAALGLALGLFGANWSVHVLTAVLPATLPRVDEIRISVPVLAFSVALMVLTAIAIALFPALQTAMMASAPGLRAGDRTVSASRGQLRIRRGLVIGEIALSVVLATGAGLLIRSFTAVAGVNAGFETKNVLALHLAVPRAKYPKDRDVAQFAGAVIERVRRLPGVTAAGMVNRLPIAGGPQQGPVEFEGQDLPLSRVGSADWRSATPDYFRAIGIPLLEGRTFSSSDTADSKPVAIIDDRTARLLWPGQSAVGKRVRAAFPGFPWMEVVGVVGRIRHDGLDTDGRTQLYWPYTQRTQDRMALVVRTTDDPARWTSAVISQIRAADPEQPVYGVATMEKVVAESLSQRRFNMWLISLFATVSILLASVGIYGVMAYSVQQRGREFGIRVAMGAGKGNLLWMVLAQGALTAVCGAAIGLAAAAVLARAISALLYDVSSTDLISYGAACVGLVLVALSASYFPARKAASVDPVQCLRGE